MQYSFLLPTIDKLTTAYEMRSQVNVDDYATFKWRGVDAWFYFGCFITNNRDLKWVNAAAVSSTYTKPMFSSSRELISSTPANKSLTMKLVAYAISYEDYRKLVNWLALDVIDSLEYSYNKDWSFEVKISKVSETNFFKVGVEQTTGEDLYCAEFTVTFETINDNYVTYNQPWSYQLKQGPSVDGEYFLFPTNNTISEVDTTVKISANFTSKADAKYIVSIAQYDVMSIGDNKKITTYNKQTLFSLHTNLDGVELGLEYDSKKGILLVNNKLISLLMVNDSGDEIVKGYSINKFVIPGILNNSFLTNPIQVGTEQFLPFLISVETTAEESFADGINIMIYPKREM